jgi:hypothetical protein
MLGLAVTAALMAMALVGAGSAMAEGSTALCKADESPCAAGNIITHVHESTLAGNPGLLLSSVVNILCDVLFLGDTLNGGLGNPLVIHGHFTYTNCMHENGTCTVTETSTDSLISILRLGSELADVSGTGIVNAHCGFFINCTYDGEGLLGHGLGPLTASETNGETRVEEAVTHKTGGSLCPETAKLDLLTTPLEKTYISS